MFTLRLLEEGVKLSVLSKTNYTRNLKFVMQVQTSMESQKIYHIAPAFPKLCWSQPFFNAKSHFFLGKYSTFLQSSNMMDCSKDFLFCSICFEIKVFWNKEKKLLTMITLSASFAVWLIREMTKIMSGYFERVNEKAVVAYYENFTKTNPSSWNYNEV